MALHLTQVVIGATATAFAADNTYACWMRVEADDGNSNPCWIGDSTVTSANGQRLNNSATAPEDFTVEVGGLNLINLKEWYVAGTNGEKVNVIFITR